MSTPLVEYAAPMDPLVEVLGFRLSTATVLYHSAIADRLGIGVTDVKCYSILRQSGSLTAGELGERVGLTTGAITGVIDRLERAQLVQRVRDPNDRRRVVLEVLSNPEHEQALAQLYGPMGRAIMELVGQYSEAERATLLDFITRATAILEAETTNLRRAGT
ncbi:MAG TPA: MarR family transcriptional regulator [Roseiflexaceae bacterium]|nr:MarR family transcriptional regulator [Roseiflexaceae bacterium]